MTNNLHPVTREAAALAVIAVVENAKAAGFTLDAVLATIRATWEQP